MTTDTRIPIFDGHNDTLTKLGHEERDTQAPFVMESESRHLDLPRALDAALFGGMFAIAIPDEWVTMQAPSNCRMIDRNLGRRFILSMMSLLRTWERESQGRFILAHTVDMVRACQKGSCLAAILHFEGAEAIRKDLGNLESFYEHGMRSLGIVWARPNGFGFPVPMAFPSSPDVGPGLTDAGKNLVRACNEMGIVIDLSHLNEAGFWDVAKLSRAPLVATHSNVHALCPAPRNLTDRQLDAIGASGGLVGINLHVPFLRPDGKEDPNTSLDTVVHHVAYITERIGIEHVALGSDFDGATIPADLGNVSGLPRLLQALRLHGYSEAQLHLIAYGNWLRILDHILRSP